MDGDINKLVTMYSSIDSSKQMRPWYLAPSVGFVGKNRSSDKIQDGEYSCAWKLCQWDSFEESKL